jgi:hypothetical protein
MVVSDDERSLMAEIGKLAASLQRQRRTPLADRDAQHSAVLKLEGNLAARWAQVRAQRAGVRPVVPEGRYLRR